MTSKLRIIVTGLIAQYPLGGVTWDYFQYVLGLAQLGHDVYYLEDTGQWPYNPQEGGLGKDCDFNVQYLAAVMSRYGLARAVGLSLSVAIAVVWACRCETTRGHSLG